MRTLGVKSAKIHPGTAIETANQSYEPGIDISGYRKPLLAPLLNNLKGPTSSNRR